MHFVFAPLAMRLARRTARALVVEMPATECDYRTNEGKGQIRFSEVRQQTALFVHPARPWKQQWQQLVTASERAIARAIITPTRLLLVVIRRISQLRPRQITPLLW